MLGSGTEKCLLQGCHGAFADSPCGLTLLAVQEEVARAEIAEIAEIA